MSSNYILSRSKDEEILKKAAVGGAVTGILQYLLDNNIIDGVLTLKPEDDIYDGIPTIATTSEELLKTSGSLHCAPTMTADLISKYLSDKKIGIAVKPCDAKAVNELIKRHRINPDNIYTIGLNCGGTISPITAREMLKLYYDIDPSSVVKEEIAKGKFIVELEDGSEKAVSIDELEENGYGRRHNCQRCDLKVPRNADIACGNWGAEDGWTFIEINSEKGAKIVNQAKAEGYIEGKTPSEKAIGIRNKIENLMIKMGEKEKTSLLDEDISIGSDEWNRCIQCYACKDICPICWCNECELEKSYFENENENCPPSAISFQGVRLSHMAFSCVNCGQCGDVCPMEIPVDKLFDKIQGKYKNRTGYVAGISEEKPPLYSPKKEIL